jgi:hypothetical protein
MLSHGDHGDVIAVGNEYATDFFIISKQTKNHYFCFKTKKILNIQIKKRTVTYRTKKNYPKNKILICPESVGLGSTVKVNVSPKCRKFI